MAELENTTETETETPSPTKAEAEDLWGQLREGLVNVEKVIVKIIETWAWEPLGYTNFLEAWNDRLKGIGLATDALRAVVVYALLDSGASDDEVIEATGVADSKVAHFRKMKALGSPPEVAMTQARKTRHSVRHSSTVSFGLEPAEFTRIEDLCSERGVALAELARRGLRLQVYAMEAE